MKSGVRPVLKGKVLPLAAGLGLLASPGFANGVPDTEARLASLETAVRSAQSAGDNAWMLVSAALVLMMTGPGLALFYGGLVRRKNVLGTMMHSFVLMAVVTVIWAVVGYSLAFGGSGSFIGQSDARFSERRGQRAQSGLRRHHPAADLHGLPVDVRHHHAGADLRSLRRAHEIQRHAAVHGSVEPARLLPDGAHGVGQGRLAERVRSAARFPCFDFAGGTVVHITSGVSALVCALYLGKRMGYPGESMKPHNLVISFIGACLLWVGWFGFNAGSALAASAWPPAPLSRPTSARPPRRSAGSLAEWMHNGKPSVLGGISGCVAGLVAITPASGFVKPFPALLIGVVRRRRLLLDGDAVKAKFGYDDSLDAFGVHGAGGTLGAILTGVFATSAINDALKGRRRHAPLGLVDGNAGQILNQVWAPHRVGAGDRGHAGHPEDLRRGGRPARHQEQEIEGLDVSMHGEEGYILEA